MLKMFLFTALLWPERYCTQPGLYQCPGI